MKRAIWIVLASGLLPACVGGNLLEYARDMPGAGTSRVRVSNLGEIERVEVDVDVSRTPGEVQAAAGQELEGGTPDRYYWWANDQDSDSQQGFGISAEAGRLDVLFTEAGARVGRRELIELTDVPEEVSPLISKALQDAGLAAAQTLEVRRFEGSGDERFQLLLEQEGRRYSLVFDRTTKTWSLYRLVDAVVAIPMSLVEG